MILLAVPILLVVGLVLFVVGVVNWRRDRVLGWVGLGLVVASPLPLVWVIFRPDLMLNPIDRFFMTQFDGRTFQQPKSIIPEILLGGMSKQDVIDRLVGAGYASLDSSDPNDIRYEKGGPFAVVCSVAFVVEAKFGGSGLTDALAIRQASCL